MRDQNFEIIPKEKLIGILQIPMSFETILHVMIYLFISIFPPAMTCCKVI